MRHLGHATLKIDGELKECSVELDQNAGFVTVKYPQKTGREGFERRHFRNSYRLSDIEMHLPNGKISGGIISGLKLVQWTGGTSSIFDSDLVRNFSLYKQELGLCRLDFRPQNPLVRLPLQPFHRDANSELVYKNNILTVRFQEEIKIFRSGIHIVAEKGFLLVRSNQSLKSSVVALSQALSILQRGRMCLVAGQEMNSITLNFGGQDNPAPAGRIFDDSESNCLFVKCFVEYQRKLPAANLGAFRLAVDYIIDGCASLAGIENRMISLYTAVEILDGARTLSKNATAKLFDLDLPTSDLIVQVRNAMVHQGFQLHDSIVLKAQEINMNTGEQAFTGLDLSKSKRKIEHDFFSLVLDKLILHICKTIGIKLEIDRFDKAA